MNISKDHSLKIKNNSKDTLYGEYLPGYFWGTLSYIRNDSILATRTGRIDYTFDNPPPLYPDSVKIATVGSFGLTKNSGHLITGLKLCWQQMARRRNWSL